jgi:hypothetical protein
VHFIFPFSWSLAPRDRVISFRRFQTTQESHLQESKKNNILSLEDETAAFFVTSGTNHAGKRRYFPEKMRRRAIINLLRSHLKPWMCLRLNVCGAVRITEESNFSP